jgi:hypothetical protein
MTARTGQFRKRNLGRTAGIGQSRQVSRVISAWKILIGEDDQNMISWTEQLGQNNRDRKTETITVAGQRGQFSRDRIVRIGEP